MNNLLSIDVQTEETSSGVVYQLTVDLPDEVVVRKFLVWPLGGVAKFLISLGVELLGIDNVVVDIR